MKKIGIFMLSLTLCFGLFGMPTIANAQQEITICAVHPFTGRFAFAGIHGADAMEDAINMANEEGGINGKKIHYYWADGEYKNDVGIAAFKRLYAQYNPQCMWAQSTGMTKALAPEIKDRYKVLYSAYTCAAIAANPKENPYLFLPMPTYDEQFGLLFKYIAKEKPGANIAFFYSDTEFGREPIPYGRETAPKLGLKVVAEEISKVGGVDISTQILDMKRKKVDYCIFHGFVTTPIQTVIKQAKDYGLKCKFMGTFWSTEKHLLDQLGPLADEYMGVTTFSYYYEDQFPMIRKIRAWTEKHRPKYADYRSQAYMQVFMGTTLFIESLRRADKAGTITGDSLASALASIKNFDVGGLMPPVTMKNNSVPVGKIVRGNSKTLKFDSVSGWIYLD
jgi:branched-chain amino acid transport system substrate-binding protein